MNILEIKNLTTSFATSAGLIKAVDNVNIAIERGTIQALVGESGCGKSVTALSILRLIAENGKIESGEIWLNENNGTKTNLLNLSEKEMCHVRGNKVAMIFQEPMTSLNPVFTIGNQIREAILLHQNVSKSEAKNRTIEILKKVRIPNAEKRFDEYPHQMSGGMRQRVMIAMGLSCHPDLLIADEPTTALDVTIQAQILELMKELIAEMGMTLLLITHDMGIVAEYAQNVAVMYAGQVVEQAGVRDLFNRPHHPYTKGLLESIPSLAKRGERLKAIPGNVPHLARLPKGCRFQDRCMRVQDDCKLAVPDLREIDKDHLARCIHPW